MRDALTLIQNLRSDLHWDTVGIRSHVKTDTRTCSILEQNFAIYDDEFANYLHKVEQRLFEIQRIIEG